MSLTRREFWKGLAGLASALPFVGKKAKAEQPVTQVEVTPLKDGWERTIKTFTVPGLPGKSTAFMVYRCDVPKETKP